MVVVDSVPAQQLSLLWKTRMDQKDAQVKDGTSTFGKRQALSFLLCLKKPSFQNRVQYPYGL